MDPDDFGDSLDADDGLRQIEELRESHAELLAACKAALEALAITWDPDGIVGGYYECTACQSYAVLLSNAVHDPNQDPSELIDHADDCARVRLEAAIAKAEGR
jgi:hypothetical protein